MIPEIENKYKDLIILLVILCIELFKCLCQMLAFSENKNVKNPNIPISNINMSTKVLRKQIFDLKVEMLTYQLLDLHTHRNRFDMNYFLQSNMSVEYLKLSNILNNIKTRRTLLNMYSKLNYPCAKFLVDCYCSKKCNWDENIYDNFTEHYKKPIHFILGCHKFNDLTMQILNEYENIDLELSDISG